MNPLPSYAGLTDQRPYRRLRLGAFSGAAACSSYILRNVEEADANEDAAGTLRAVGLALAVAAAAVIAAWTLVNIWTIARPAGDGTVCMLVYPAPPGCSPHARFTPAFVSAVVVSLAYSAVTVLLLTVGRRSGLVVVWALGGLAILGILAGQFVTWGGVPR